VVGGATVLLFPEVATAGALISFFGGTVGVTAAIQVIELVKGCYRAGTDPLAAIPWGFCAS
jgi:hypothetical protein